ncbi:MAG: carbohydrate ABC transporter permease [Jatrophihabitans sp.]|uniref:carbohydrate ABC transporter permease n=1 Tax=Jatrophihabitans sp. TaxID=1932789 RepID=UPI003F7FCB72
MTLTVAARSLPPTQTTGTSPTPPCRRRSRAYLGIVPAVVVVGAVTVVPLLQAVNLAFHRTVFLHVGSYAGFDNFLQLFRSAEVRSGLSQTVVFTVASVVVALVCGVTVACALAETRHTAVYETILLLPWVISQLLTGLLWKFLFSPNVGLVDVMWKAVTGDSNTDLLSQPGTAMACLVVANVWEIMPFAVVITLSALRTVPAELHEAAAMDGASKIRSYLLIILPQIKGSIFVVTVMLSLHSFNMVQLPLLITGGGPANGTNLLGLQVYRDAFVSYNFGSASALALVMFVINVVFTIVYMRLLKARVQ